MKNYEYETLHFTRCTCFHVFSCVAGMVTQDPPLHIRKAFKCNLQRLFSPIKLEKFIIFTQNIDCRYTLESPRRGSSNEYVLDQK